MVLNSPHLSTSLIDGLKKYTPSCGNFIGKMMIGQCYRDTGRSLIFRQTSWKVLQHIQERTNWGILSLWPVYRRNRLLRRSHNLAKGIVKWKLRIVYSRMIVVSCTVLKKHPIFLLPKSLSHLQHSEDHPMISGFSSDQQNLDGPWFVLYLPPSQKYKFVSWDDYSHGKIKTCSKPPFCTWYVILKTHFFPIFSCSNLILVGLSI